jgi:hypothetical protein
MVLFLIGGCFLVFALGVSQIVNAPSNNHGTWLPSLSRIFSVVLPDFRRL